MVLHDLKTLTNLKDYDYPYTRQPFKVKVHRASEALLLFSAVFQNDNQFQNSDKGPKITRIRLAQSECFYSKV
jgi:hypothetical protein